MLPTYEQWLKYLGLKFQINPVLLSHYRERINVQRGLAR